VPGPFLFTLCHSHRGILVRACLSTLPFTAPWPSSVPQLTTPLTAANLSLYPILISALFPSSLLRPRPLVTSHFDDQSSLLRLQPSYFTASRALRRIPPSVLSISLTLQLRHTRPARRSTCRTHHPALLIPLRSRSQPSEHIQDDRCLVDSVQNCLSLAELAVIVIAISSDTASLNYQMFRHQSL